MIVLASSRKLGGRCIAGISTDSGEWVRPVARAQGGLDKFRCMVDGRWPELFDIVRFDCERCLDDPAQPENVLIDGRGWDLVGRLDPGDAYVRLAADLAPGPELLGNRGKAVKEDIAAEGVDASLALVESDTPITFVLKPPQETQGKSKPCALFRIGGRVYELPLTDFTVKPLVLEAGVGVHSAEDLGLEGFEKILLTISLGEAHQGWHSKLAAAVLFLP